MKKIITMLATLAIAAVVYGCVFDHDATDDNDGLVYCNQQDAIVTDVLKQRVTVVREDGHIFEFVGNGYNVGDIVTFTVDTKNTSDVSDDTVWHVAKRVNL